MGDLHIALISDFVLSAVEDDFHPTVFADGLLFLVTKLVYQLSKTLVIIEIPLVVAHVGIKFYLLFMLNNLRPLFVGLQGINLFLILLVGL